MYSVKNFKTKKALKEAVALYNAGDVPEGKAFRGPTPVLYYQPGPFGGNEPLNGEVFLEGPHFPEPHRWYAQCTCEGGVIVGVK